jgi:hypothetical protein
VPAQLVEGAEHVHPEHVSAAPLPTSVRVVNGPLGHGTSPLCSTHACHPLAGVPLQMLGSHVFGGSQSVDDVLDKPPSLG